MIKQKFNKNIFFLPIIGYLYAWYIHAIRKYDFSKDISDGEASWFIATQVFSCTMLFLVILLIIKLG